MYSANGVVYNEEMHSMRLEAVQVDIGLVKDLQEPVVHVHTVDRDVKS